MSDLSRAWKAAAKWHRAATQEQSEMRLGIVVKNWALREEIKRLRDALEAVEWGCGDDDYCPGCGGWKETGHNAWCELYAALKGTADD